jgi:hypothetical protein
MLIYQKINLVLIKPKIIYYDRWSRNLKKFFKKKQWTSLKFQKRKNYFYDENNISIMVALGFNGC